MSHDVCDFTIAVRLVSAAGTVLVDLNNHTVGLDVMRPLVPPVFSVRDIRVDSPRVDGTFRVAEAFDDGYLPVRISVRGTSWAQVDQRWEALLTQLMAEPVYFIETEIEGVKRRYRTERPNAEPGDVDTIALMNKRMTFLIAFRVQPNPTVTYV